MVEKIVLTEKKEEKKSNCQKTDLLMTLFLLYTWYICVCVSAAAALLPREIDYIYSYNSVSVSVFSAATIFIPHNI